MSSKSSEQTSIAAAHAREFVAGRLKGKDPKYVREFAGMVGDDEIVDLLNYMCGVYADVGKDFTETTLYRRILRSVATSAVNQGFFDGDVSVLQGNVGLVNHKEDATDASTRSWLRNRHIGEAYVGFVVGGMGSGKTDFVLSRVDEWHMETRGRVATNIESAADENPFVEFIDDYEALEEFFEESEGDAAFIYDESGRNLTDKGSDSKGTKAVAEVIKLVRKGDAPAGSKRALWLIGQTVRDAGRDLRRLVASCGDVWRKKDKTTVEVYDNLVSGEIEDKTPERTIGKLKKTRLEYDTTEKAGFDLSAVYEQLDDDGDDLDGDDEHIKNAIEAHMPWTDDAGHSVREIAEMPGFIPYQRTWVSDRVKEWRRGQYRDLVPDPTDTGGDDST